MFVAVKDLTNYIDRNINYVNEAIANKSNFDDVAFNTYIIKMSNTLNRQIDSLKSISSSNKLIEKYAKKVNDLFSKSN